MTNGHVDLNSIDVVLKLWEEHCPEWFLKLDHWRYDNKWHATAVQYNAPCDSEGSTERACHAVADTALAGLLGLFLRVLEEKEKALPKEPDHAE